MFVNGERCGACGRGRPQDRREVLELTFVRPGV